MLSVYRRKTKKLCIPEIHVSGDLVHCQGKQLCHFHCCLPCKLGSSHEVKKLLLSEVNVYTLRVSKSFIFMFFSSHLYGVNSSRKEFATLGANRESRKLFPFENMVEKRWSFITHTPYFKENLMRTHCYT